jgi:hypothetical protein
MVFHENGNIKTTGTYAKGRKVGLWVQCNEGGDTVSMGTIGPDGVLRLDTRFAQASARPAQPSVSSAELIPRREVSIAGACLFGTSYGIGAIAGIAAAGSGNGSDDNVALCMLVPVVGPIAMWVAADASWTFPELLVPCGLTLAQSLGLVLVVKGRIGFPSVVVGPTLDGNGVGATVAVHLPAARGAGRVGSRGLP